MDLYDTAPEYQTGTTQLTGQRAASALRVSKLITVKCVNYLNQKGMRCTLCPMLYVYTARILRYRVEGLGLSDGC